MERITQDNLWSSPAGWAPDWPADLVQALADAGVDLDQVTQSPDGVVRIPVTPDGWVALGCEDGWWQASDHDGNTVHEGEDVAELAAAVARAVGRG